jgi:hypothetical protein
MNQREATPAVCEVKLENGRACGVLAEGRCIFCGHAFCKTHHARSVLSVYTSACAPCYPKTPAGQEQQAVQERAEAERYFTPGEARKALLASGVQPVNIYLRDHEWKKNIFDRNRELVPVFNLSGRGWILGNFSWNYMEWDGFPRVGDFLTALLDIPGDDDWKYITSIYGSCPRATVSRRV